MATDRQMEELKLYFQGKNSSLQLMNKRLGNIDLPHYKPDTVDGANEMAHRLKQQGGFAQQNRMIQDKRRTLDKATMYSYQGAWVKKQAYDFEPLMEGIREAPPVRALINPNKLKQDYDDKIISVRFDYGFQTGDVFEWCNTNSYWLIYLQDLTELAYFRGDIRRCSYEVQWEDEEGKLCRTFMALRGPVETKIDYIQKHGISVDNPNYSLDFLIPKNTDTLKKFKRYSKFYLQDMAEGEDKVCWRVESVNTFSTPGIIKVSAVEYYANETNDDIDKGIVDAFVVKPIDPNPPSEGISIQGETFIKPKKEYVYYIDTKAKGKWYFIDAKLPIKYETFVNDKGYNAIRLKWDTPFSGQFDLYYETSTNLQSYKKTIVIESLF